MNNASSPCSTPRVWPPGEALATPSWVKNAPTMPRLQLPIGPALQHSATQPLLNVVTSPCKQLASPEPSTRAPSSAALTPCSSFSSQQTPRISAREPPCIASPDTARVPLNQTPRPVLLRSTTQTLLKTHPALCNSDSVRPFSTLMATQCYSPGPQPTEMRRLPVMTTPRVFPQIPPQKLPSHEADKENHVDANTLHCEEGHVMRVRVPREMFLWLPRYWAHCNNCEAQIERTSASYCCKECDYFLCSACSMQRLRKQSRARKAAEELSFPRALNLPFQTQETHQMVMAGDIFFCGPDMWNLHHVVLCCGPMRLADAESISHIYFHCPEVIGLTILECETIESSQPLHGQDHPWYLARTFFAQRRVVNEDGEYCGLELLQVADLADGSWVIGVSLSLGFGEPWVLSDGGRSEVAVPVKILLHPLRPRPNTPVFNEQIFSKAVKACAKVSQQWSKATAVRALAAKRERIDPDDYEGSEGRKQLMSELGSSWSSRPICSSVAISIWQRYFLFLCCNRPDGLDITAQLILRWMPVRCDRTTPSALLKVLSTCGWSLRTTFEA